MSPSASGDDRAPGPDERAYTGEVGLRLRRIREERGLSLRGVEILSDEEFKASALSAYERGERIISVARLHRLAILYGLRAGDLLPHAAPDDLHPTTVIDLTTIERARDATATITGFVDTVRRTREDRTRDAADPALRIRATDLWALAAMTDNTSDEIGRRLVKLGVRAGSTTARDGRADSGAQISRHDAT